VFENDSRIGLAQIQYHLVNKSRIIVY